MVTVVVLENRVDVTRRHLSRLPKRDSRSCVSGDRGSSLAEARKRSTVTRVRRDVDVSEAQKFLSGELSAARVAARRRAWLGRGPQWSVHARVAALFAGAPVR